jgi:hypothetical protein
VRAALQKPLEKVVQIDLFQAPQRERFRTQVIALRKERVPEREIARQLGITQPVVQYAAALRRMMDKLGVTDPYVPVLAPPDDSKLRRHKHPRYRFEPLPDAGQF